MVAAAVIGSAVIGGVVSTSSANKAKRTAERAADMASDASAAQLDFNKQQYADQKPYIDAANEQALSTAKLNEQIAQQGVERSQTAWNQNQQATQASVGQMGLNALGAQYLSPEQIKQLIVLQKTMSTGTPEQKAAAQAQLSELQRAAQTSAIGLEQAKANSVLNTTAGQGEQVQAAYGVNATATRQHGADQAAGLAAIGNTYASGVAGLGEGNAQSILHDAGTMQGDLNAAGDARRADQTGFYDKQAQQVRDTAAQRAADFEREQTAQGNADIANSADQAQRQLLRLGGDPNRMAAMGADIANSQQLARIGNGNQIGRTNVANLNAADDAARGLEQTGFSAGTQQQYELQNQAMGVKSAALDAARASRTQAQQTALGLRADAATQGLAAVSGANQAAADKTLAGTSAAQQLTFAGQNQANAINNNARDKVDAGLNALQQGTANYGAGFANTSGQTAQTAIAAGAAGTNGLSAATNAATNAQAPVNQGFGNAVSAANAVTNASKAILDAGQAEGKAIADTGAAVGGYIQSSKKVKKNRRKVDPDAALAGLENALPQSYEYKDGMGPPGRKVGAMAEDLQAEFGDDVAPGGKAVSVQNMLGLQHAAIAAIGRRLDKLEHHKAA